jgi:D-alanyl-lipoteichoic acid acyltransferase DltB (MBOAT superfamily)
LRLPGLSRLYTAVAFIALLALLVVLKSEAGSTWLSAGLRALNAQAAASASPLDIRWLGYSYLAFRLIHLLRDGADGRLGPVRLQTFLAYALFLPAYTAGPIDRYQRFSKDGEKPLELAPGRLEGLRRLAVGLFKKFAVADSLALLALSPQNSAELISTPWAWVTLYGYALRLYFDFSGYTDIAIGLGLCLGFRLPENFQGPYLKTNLIQFWNAWHITLTQWLRGYVYNPMMRALRRRAPTADPRGMILFGQISVMLLIGLWHGLNWNFAIWGLWHAAGLFINGQWSEWLRARQATRPLPERLQPALRLAGWALTFQYVTLGWVWFALPDTSSALRVFGLLFGLSIDYAQ